MKFISTTFPNITCSEIENGIQIAFVNGDYYTTDAKEIEYLKKNGYTVVEDAEVDNAVAETINTGMKTVSTRMTTAQIKEYADKEGIVLPDTLVTKQDMVDYIIAH